MEKLLSSVTYNILDTNKLKYFKPFFVLILMSDENQKSSVLKCKNIIKTN